MLLAVISDTHFGIKNSSDIFLDYQERFFSEIFFPYCIKHDIKTIIHMGDFYDNRKFLAVKTLRRTRKFFFDPLVANGMTMHIIPGNHCVSFKNTNELCSLKEVLPQYMDQVKIYMQPTVLQFDSLALGVLPWITSDNYSASMKFVETAPADIIASHLELQGFEMMKGAPVTSHGMGADAFARYEMVLSGHYHTKSSQGNVHYLGTQYELTWADADDAKYFHILDTETRDLLSVHNPLCIFQRIVYSDANVKDILREIATLDVSHLKGTFVKIIVASKKDPYAFDKFLDRLQLAEPFDIKITESLTEFAGDSIPDDEIDLADTGKLLDSYVDAIETELDKDRLKSKLQELFAEAQTMDAM